MSKFKVGDRVRHRGTPFKGNIKQVDDNTALIQWDTKLGFEWLDIELLRRLKPKTPKVTMPFTVKDGVITINKSGIYEVAVKSCTANMPGHVQVSREMLTKAISELLNTPNGYSYLLSESLDPLCKALGLDKKESGE